MSTITYKDMGREVKVYSGGLRVGTIRINGKGYRYCPKGASGKNSKGETLVSVEAVKQTLEAA